MGNEIDEVTGSTDQNGRDINVINKQIRVEVGNESTIFEIALWLVGTIPGIIILTTDAMPVLQGVGVLAAGFLPGVIFQFMKISALAYLRRLQQKVQADASQIDNYLEQRVIILQNVVGLVEKSIELDKDVMKSVAAYRAGRLPTTDTGRNAASQELDGIFSRVNVAFEAYPELKAQATLADAMRQNS
ncbi:MAG: LemA family protein [Proteobacteria bacterium]|nr:LemA family protein [Pseudomonadota bacterium]